MPDKKAKFDGPVEISIGKDRHETHWKNKKLLWSRFAEKLSTPHRTAETFTEYKAAKRKRRDEIKDIGGFVGGYIAGGRRKSGAVLYRTLITLDADTAIHQFWEVYTALYGEAAVIYSTHSHEPENPRYRLVMPLNRHVEPDEYQAIARRIAGNLGIDQFDNTGFQDERLMYWPSCSIDGDWVYQVQKGPFLDADAVLGSYIDWTDASQWPVAAHVETAVRKNMKKQGEPTEKRGVIGAFCRTYTISAAIEKYLSEAYEACDIEGRYTYVRGSTSAGLVVYDDKFAYSHHGTDPTGGKLCNAFDLVRLHLYGEQDEGLDDVPVTARPSYKAMQQLAVRDGEVKHQLGIERMEGAKDAFEAAGIDVNEINTDWLKELDTDKDGGCRSTIDNIVLVLCNDPLLKGCLRFDEFRRKNLVVKDLPWRKAEKDMLLTDADESGIRHHVEKAYGISSPGKVHDAIEIVLRKNGFHPVRDYLNGLVWDGEFRLDTLLIDYMGAEDNEYVRTVTRKAMVAAVARVMQPGCKFDTVLVLIGPQGIGKSTFIDVMGGQWFSDTFSTVQGKEAYEQIQGFWIIEVSELAGLRKAEHDQIKHFLAKRNDSFRPAYGRHTVDCPRQCIFIGTTNEDAFLRDPTGNRRYWPLRVVGSDKLARALTPIRNQLWAEALAYHLGGEKLYLEGEVAEAAKTHQTKHTEEDGRKQQIIDYLNTPITEGWDKLDIWQRRSYFQGETIAEKGTVTRKKITALEIWQELFGGGLKDFTKSVSRDINDVLRSLPNWKYGWVRSGFNLSRGFNRLTSSVTEQAHLFG